MKKIKRLKAKIKKQKKLHGVRVHEFLEEVNYHCEQVTAALRNLADKLDDVRSYHLKDKPK
jgi:hypothetical protein